MKAFGWVITHGHMLTRHDGVRVRVNKIVHANWFRQIGIVGADTYVYETRHDAQAVLKRLKTESGSFKIVFVGNHRTSIRKIWFGGILK